MIGWLIFLALLWLGALGLFSIRSYRQNRDATDYIFAGSNLGVFIGLLTFAATLFSTFIFMGMPDFFRVHGVGAWIFLAVSDAAMFFFILWFGHRLRAHGAGAHFRGMSDLLQRAYGAKWVGLGYLVFVFIFMIPYVAIQIRGIALFLSAIFPDFLPAWTWSTAIVVIMLIYSEIGGLRAIVYSDALQALLLLVAIWIIALTCLARVGGVDALFDRVAEIEPALLSTPGPRGLMTFQFLAASFFAIVMIPVTQPQVVTRLMIMRDTRRMHRMALSMGFFAFLVLTATVFIGFYGAVFYTDAPTSVFLAEVLLFEQASPVAALVVVGLLAAAISTSDSQIFALGTELRSLLRGNERLIMRITRAAILLFGLSALVFSLLSSDQFALLARVSFAGTAIMGPMILAAIFSQTRPGLSVAGVSLAALCCFLASLLGWIPDHYFGWRLDLIAFVGVSGYTIIYLGAKKLSRKE